MSKNLFFKVCPANVKEPGLYPPPELVDDGRLPLGEVALEDVGPGCEIDRITSKAYLHHLFKAGELLAMQIASIHNLAFYLRLVTDARGEKSASHFLLRMFIVPS